MYLEAEDLWLDKVERLSVNLDKTLSGLYRILSQYSVPPSYLGAFHRTLHSATAVAVFFLPKH